MDGSVQDHGYALRRLRNNPGFILVPAFGMCAGLAIFGFVDARSVVASIRRVVQGMTSEQVMYGEETMDQGCALRGATSLFDDSALRVRRLRVDSGQYRNLWSHFLRGRASHPRNWDSHGDRDTEA